MSSHASPTPPFTRVAVLGPGLLGGSIALAVREHMPACELRLWARRDEPLQLARKLGITHLTYRDAQQAVSQAQLVIMATPIGTFPELAAAILPALSPGTIITDVGSVKGTVHHTAGQYLTHHGHTFIGSHPMAGAEKQGLEHARAALLQGATVALTNPHAATPEQLDRLAAFWQTLGCRTCELTPELHDETTARISHMPHIIAALCARAALRSGAPADTLRQLVSTGFQDTTRVSSGGASMWADILQGNTAAVLRALADCISDLQALTHLLEQQDKPGIRAWLEQAKDARENILRHRRP